MFCCSLALFIFWRLVTGEIFNMRPYTPHLQKKKPNRGSVEFDFNKLNFCDLIFLPPQIEPAGALYPAERFPDPGPRQAAAASGSATHCDACRTTGGGSGARSPPTCPEGSETLVPRGDDTTWIENLGSTSHLFTFNLTVGHDGLYKTRAGGKAVLPVVASGVVVADKHTPFHSAHQPTPLKGKKTHLHQTSVWSVQIRSWRIVQVWNHRPRDTTYTER